MTTTIYDYIPELQKKFPYLSQKEIESILFRGFRIFSYAMTKGVSFTGGTGKGSSFRYFIGTIISAAESQTAKYSSLIFKKMRFLSSLFKIPFNGKYYIGLSDEKHKEILAQGLEKTFTDIEAYKYRFCIPLIKGKHIWEVSLEEGPVRVQLEKLITTKAICIDGTSV